MCRKRISEADLAFRDVHRAIVARTRAFDLYGFASFQYLVADGRVITVKDRWNEIRKQGRS